MLFSLIQYALVWICKGFVTSWEINFVKSTVMRTPTIFFKVPSDSTVDTKVCACANIVSINILASIFQMDQSKRRKSSNREKIMKAVSAVRGKQICSLKMNKWRNYSKRTTAPPQIPWSLPMAEESGTVQSSTQARGRGRAEQPGNDQPLAWPRHSLIG
jgi:hypothetical protein